MDIPLASNSKIARLVPVFIETDSLLENQSINSSEPIQIKQTNKFNLEEIKNINKLKKSINQKNKMEGELFYNELEELIHLNPFI